MESTILEAAREGDVEAVRRCLRAGVDIEARNEFGFTALHCAAMACNKRSDPNAGPMIMRTLLEHGASPHSVSKDGRSVLYLTAEMAQTLEPVKMLVEEGADPNVTDSHGNHVVVNAMAKEVKEFLSQLTGHPIPPPPVKSKEIKLSPSEWRQVKTRLNTAFAEMDRSGLVALQDAGHTQEEGFSDCSEEFVARGGAEAGLGGMCFYARQDLNRAKSTGFLALGFWGAPDGNDQSTVRVGHRILEIFTTQGFFVDWNGTAATRPIVRLHDEGRGSGPDVDATGRER